MLRKDRAKRSSNFQDYDDSSDEETSEAQIKHYDISLNWQKYEAAVVEKSHDLNELFSFVVHAAGLKILKKNNQQYYAAKRKLLGNEKELPLAQLLRLAKKGVLSALDESFIRVRTFIETVERNAKAQQIWIKKLNQKLEEAKSKLDSILDEKSETLIELLRLQKFYNPDKGWDKLAKLCGELAVKMVNQRSNRTETKKMLRELADQKVFSLLEELYIAKCAFTEGKNKAITALENYKGNFPCLSRKMAASLSAGQANGQVQTMLTKSMQNEAAAMEIVNAYREDLVNQYFANDKQKQLTLAEKDCCKRYFQVDANAIADELNENFQFLLRRHLLHALQEFYRPTLGKSYLFKSENPSEFYVNLRLANRSQMRVTQNLQYAFSPQTHSSRFWQMVGDLPKEIVVNESEEILASSFGRKDRVEGLGNYEKIAEFIDQIKVLFKSHGAAITDAEVAQWLRQIFQGKIPDFKVNLAEIDKNILLEKLQEISFLLFGCEVKRNPAMLVINQMLLDLIMTRSDWTFVEAFNGCQEQSKPAKLMPMAPKGAVSVARAKQSKDREFMPYAYHYRGMEDSDKKNDNLKLRDLINAEGQIVREWLEIIWGLPTNKSKPELAEWLLNVIETHHHIWFTANQSDQAELLQESMTRLKL